MPVNYTKVFHVTHIFFSGRYDEEVEEIMSYESQ